MACGVMLTVGNGVGHRIPVREYFFAGAGNGPEILTELIGTDYKMGYT